VQSIITINIVMVLINQIKTRSITIMKERVYGTKRSFFQILEVSICNAYILYKLTCQKNRLQATNPFDFRMQLIEVYWKSTLGDSGKFENVSRELNQERKAELHHMRRTTERHFFTEIIAPDDESNKDVRKDCHHCSNRTKKR